MVTKRMMYMHPKSKIIKERINENKAVYRVSGSLAAPPICKMVKMALCDNWKLKINQKVTYDKSRTEMMLKVFHSRITESMKNSQVDVSLLCAGGTLEESKAI
jgi:hypothetical protein